MKTLHIVQRIDRRGGRMVSGVISILTIEKSIGIESSVISLRADGLDPSFLEMATVNILKPFFPARFRLLVSKIEKMIDRKCPLNRMKQGFSSNTLRRIQELGIGKSLKRGIEIFLGK